MFSREELAAALDRQRRRLRSIRPVDPPEKNESWRQWFLLPPDGATLPRFADSELGDIFAARPLRPRPKASRQDLARWDAFATLFRQQWEPASRDERALRIGAGAFSLVANVFFAAMLLWLMYLRFIAPPAADEGAESIRVQIVGQGTPSQDGGGSPAPRPRIEVAKSTASTVQAPASGAPSTSASDAGAPPPPALEQAVLAAPPVQPQSASTPPLAAPAPLAQATPDIAQPVQVSKALDDVPARVQLPPTHVIPIARSQPRVEAPALPDVASVPMTDPAPVAPAPTPAPQPAEEAPASLSSLRMPRIAAATAAPSIRIQDVSGMVQAVPTREPSAADAVGRATAQTAAPAAATANGKSTGTPHATSTATGSPTTVAGTGKGLQPAAQGAGAATRPASGSGSSALKNDDWGAASRNVAGTTQGNSTRGSGNRPGSTPMGDLLPDSFKAHPPNPYKEGSWIKRPGITVNGTVFDKYWIPPQNLLDEWISKGIKSITIPLPGSDTVVLNCIVSPFGFSCVPGAGKNGVHDQPAVARKPPAVPFKRALFQDQGALGTPAPAPAPVQAAGK